MKKSLLLIPTLLFLFFFFPTTVHAQITLDPNNPGARPDPASLTAQNIREVRLVLKDDTATINYVRSLKQAGINVIGIINWEYNHAAWTTGNIDNNYIQTFGLLIQDAYSKFGPLKAYQIWNEPDGVSGTIPLTPQAYASLLAASNNILHGLSQPLISAGFVSGNVQYIKDMLTALNGVFPADGIAYHPYVNPNMPNAIQNIINSIVTLNTLTGRPVWITEFGWETTNQSAQAAWLGAVFSLLSNPETRPILQTVMWYAYSDTQKAGFGLLNADGTPKMSFSLFLQILAGGPIPPDLLQQLLDLLVPIPTITPGAPVDEDTTCSNSEYQGTLRPHAYSAACKVPNNVPNSTKAYATTFTVATSKEFDVEDIGDNKIECGDLVYPRLSWTALIAEDYSKTETPWVSFGRNTEENKSILPEAKYLADYLEGTALYDGKNYLLSSGTDQDGTWQNAGVFRKLAPDWYQDELKCAMVEKAKNNSKYNYLVELKWSNEDIFVIKEMFKTAEMLINSGNVLETFINLYIQGRVIFTAIVSADIDFLCHFLPAGLNPCQQNLANFKCPPQGYPDRFWHNIGSPIEAHLWAAVPMFSREDTPGTVTLTAQNPPGNLTGITEGFTNDATNKVTHALSIPHVQRANDLAKTLQYMILPASLQKSIALSETKPNPLTIIASPNTNTTQNNQETTLPSKTLLAAETSDSGFVENTCGLIIENGFVKAYNNQRDSCGDIADYAMTVEYAIDGGGYQVACNPSIVRGELFPQALDGRFDPRNISDNDHGTAGHCGKINGRNITDITNSSFKVKVTTSGGTGQCQLPITRETEVIKNPDGTWSAVNCGYTTPPPPPTCGYEGRKVGDRNISGKLDPKDPDRLDNVRNEKLQQNLENPDAVPIDPIRVAKFSDKLTECRECRGRIPPRSCHDKCKITFHYETEISSTLLLPYLEKIQKFTAKGSQSGFFNIIRSASIDGFKSADSKTNVEYSADNGRDTDTGQSLDVEVKPSSGFVEFPYLQGVYNAQACVSQRLLLPANFAANVACPISAIP